jgi:outer membrane receptor protein involved in Fe transport
VMQIFTKKGRLGMTRPQVEGKASVGGVANVDGTGTKAFTDNTASVLGGSDKASFSLDGTYRRMGEWRPAYGANFWNVSSGAQTTQGPFTISGSARYSENTHDDPWNTRFKAYFPFSKPFNRAERVRQQTYGVTAAYQATPRWRHTLSIGYDRNYDIQDQPVPRFLTPADSFLFVSTADQGKTSFLYHTDFSMALRRNVATTVTAGVDHYAYDYLSVSTSGATKLSGFINGSTSAYHVQWTNTGYFAQVQLGLAERLFLTGGLRAERNPNFGPNFGTAFSPRAGAAYVTSAGPATLKVRASYGESIRPPSIGATTASQTALGIRLANPDLGPERQHGTDGGLEVDLGQRASFGVTYYNQLAIDLIDLVTIPTEPGTLPTTQSQNVGRIKNDGWEFEGRFVAGAIAIAGTYSITHSTVQQLSPTYTGDYQLGDRVLGIPRSSAGATITYTPLRHTTVTGSMTYLGHWIEQDAVAMFGYLFGGQPYRGSTRAYWIEYPAVTKFAVSIGQEFTNQLGGFVRVENVGNTRRFEVNNFNNVPMPRSVVSGLNFHF